MACLEHINIQLLSLQKDDPHLCNWVEAPSQKALRVPHIFFDDGEPWLAANQYALSKLQNTSGSNLKTIISNMTHLKAYASWLDKNGVDWRDFPKKKIDRCLFRYRGHLIQQRESGQISPSTTTTRMNAIIQFYRWANTNGLNKMLWDDKIKGFNFISKQGFSRTLSVVSSELAIPNRKRHGLTLEDGLTPLIKINLDTLLMFLRDKSMLELNLIIMIGVFSGARSETIRTLRIESIENASDDSTNPSIKLVKVGPGTKVKTKFDVSGHHLFPDLLIQLLERYAYSVRRLKRQARASENNKSLLFLTERGNPYSETTFTKLISNLREKLIGAGYTQLHDFKFHQTRATFGTTLMRFAMNTFKNQSEAIIFVRNAMLHKDESTTWKYVKFIESEPVKEKLSEEFFNLFAGIEGDAGVLIDQINYDNAP